MERVKTGIKGVDALVGGGFPRGHSVLICGSPGTGKTIFGLQYLYMGAKKFNENGVYLSVEENPVKLRKYAKEFGWDDIDKLESDGKIEFLRLSPNEKKFDVVERVKERCHAVNAKRMVIDSLSAIYMAFEDVTKFIYSFIDLIEEMGITSVFITDSPPGSSELTKDGVSEFVCDGVLQLQLHDVSKTVNRTISVKKMRGTNIIPGMNSLKFTSTGLEVEDYKAFY
jgi:circadian clock protein KaiC